MGRGAEQGLQQGSSAAARRWGTVSMRQLIVLLSTLFLLGCNQQQMIGKFSSPAEQAVAKAYIADLQARKFNLIENDLDPSRARLSLAALATVKGARQVARLGLSENSIYNSKEL